MALTFDALSASAQVTTNDASWTHTPGAAPRGVLVFVITGANISTDIITSVTYGGVAMTEVPNSPAVNAAGSEFGGVHAFFLGSGIPTGPQTVYVTGTGTATKRGYAFSILGSADTEIEDSQSVTVGGGGAIPLNLVTGSGVETFVAAGIWSANSSTGTISVGSDYTSGGFTDTGSSAFGVMRRTVNGAGGTVVADWTHSSDESAFVAIAIKEVAGGGATEYDGELAADSGASSADFAATYAPPEYAGALDATSGNSTGDFAGTYSPPEYAGALDAGAGSATADFAGTYDGPGYAGDLGATSGASSAEFSGSYQAPEYDGALDATSGASSGDFAGTYAAPGYSGALTAGSGSAAASFAGTYHALEYAGTLDAQSQSASSDFAGTYEPPPGGVLSVAAGPASAAFAGTYAPPGYAGALGAGSLGATVTFAGTYAVPTYTGVLGAVSGPALARFSSMAIVPLDIIELEVQLTRSVELEVQLTRSVELEVSLKRELAVFGEL